MFIQFCKPSADSDKRSKSSAYSKLFNKRDPSDTGQQEESNNLSRKLFNKRDPSDTGKQEESNNLSHIIDKYIKKIRDKIVPLEHTNTRGKHIRE